MEPLILFVSARLPALFHDNHISVTPVTAEFHICPRLTRKLWHRGAGDRRCTVLAQVRVWPLLLVWTPARVLSMANREILSALWRWLRGPCVFPHDKGCGSGSALSLSHPTPTLRSYCTKIPSKHMGTNASASVLHAWPVWHSYAFTRSHLSPTGIFTGVSSLWFSHLSTAPLYRTQ